MTSTTQTVEIDPKDFPDIDPSIIEKASSGLKLFMNYMNHLAGFDKPGLSVEKRQQMVKDASRNISCHPSFLQRKLKAARADIWAFIDALNTNMSAASAG